MEKEGIVVKIPANTKLWIMAVVLGLLIVVSVVQAVELVSLKNTINTKLTGLAVAEPSISAGSSSTNLQKNLQNLPSMVGGC